MKIAPKLTHRKILQLFKQKKPILSTLCNQIFAWKFSWKCRISQLIFVKIKKNISTKIRKFCKTKVHQKHTYRKCEMTMAACSVLQRHMTSGSVIQTVWHYQMSYDAAIYLYDAAGCQNDAAGCQNDAAGCQNDAAKPHFEVSQDTWMHGYLHVCSGIHLFMYFRIPH